MQPETSRLQIILAAQAEVFGPTTDALVRGVAGHIGPAERPAFVELIETWPLGEDGDALYHHLVALRAAPARLPPGVKPGSGMAAATGGALGAALALPIGFVGYFAASLVLPSALRSSDGLMWGIIGVVTLAGCAIGARAGATPSRGAHALVRGLLGFLLGTVLGAILGLLVVGSLGSVFGVSQREGGFAMGVVFGVMPLSGLIGGAAIAFWMGRKAWHGWGS